MVFLFWSKIAGFFNKDETKNLENSRNFKKPVLKARLKNSS